MFIGSEEPLKVSNFRRRLYRSLCTKLLELLNTDTLVNLNEKFVGNKQSRKEENGLLLVFRVPPDTIPVLPSCIVKEKMSVTACTRCFESKPGQTKIIF